MSYTEERTAFVVGLAAGAARERRRIRRLIAPHLVDIYHQLGMIETNALRAIDAATRAPKKARTK
jgi:hypothetical protein